ncbi:GAF domain-containing protein [Clostridium sp. YIM B02569]|uniref:GAF domain-containing protein n=1 Tax=Clostridium sp. YIM B02569 TaxID=2911967 RepID=UPI001EEA831A|nr:GAF domain-containing protein [Clostridium sp. YIM B02569]
MSLSNLINGINPYVGVIGSVITIVLLIGSICKFVFNHVKIKKEFDKINNKYSNLIKKIDFYGKEFYCSFSKKSEIDKKVETIIEELNVQGGSIYIKYPYDKSWHIFLSQITKGKSDSDLSKIPFRLSSTSAGQCFLNKAPQITNDASHSRKFNNAADKKIGFHTKRLLEYPIIHNNEVIAVLQLINKENDFTNDDLNYVKVTYEDELKQMIRDFINVPNYIDTLDIHRDILNTNRIIVAMDISSSQNIFKCSESDITAIMIIKEYYNLVSRITREHGGYIDNYLGDGILISFNYSNDNIQEIKELMKSIIAIKTEFDKLKETWVKSFNEKDIEDVFIRLGVTIGEVKVVSIDSGYQNKMTIMGKNVNLAFNMCNELLRTKSIIAIDHASYNKISSVISVESIELKDMKKTEKLTNEIFEIINVFVN